MNEPGYSPSVSASPGESLWRASGWRSLTIAASALTLAALALPLLPGPATAPVRPAAMVRLEPVTVTPEKIFPPLPPSPPRPAVRTVVHPAHIAAPTPSVPAAPEAVTVQPMNPAPVQAAPLTHQTPSPALNQPVAPTEQHQIAPDLPVGTIIVPSGVLTKVNRHARGSSGHEWPVTITVISPPAHGKVTTQFAIGPNRTPNGTQIGNGTVVYYQSIPGYIGMDTFTYKRTSGDATDPLNANTYTMTIDVN